MACAVISDHKFYSKSSAKEMHVAFQLSHGSSMMDEHRHAIRNSACTLMTVQRKLIMKFLNKIS